MKKFKKKPVTVEAEQWFKCRDIPRANISRNLDYIMNCRSVPEHATCNKCGFPWKDHGLCPTLEGHRIVCPGDWIVKGVKGEFYPCKPDIFEMTYEPIEDE